VASGKWQEQKPACRRSLEGAAPAAPLWTHAHTPTRSDEVQTHEGIDQGCDQGWRPLPATPRRPLEPRPLLPSGPGGVDGLTTRGDRQGPPQKLTRPETADDTHLGLAEREGFEPSKRGLAAYTLSRRAPSTARTSLHIRFPLHLIENRSRQRARNHNRVRASDSTITGADAATRGHHRDNARVSRSARAP